MPIPDLPLVSPETNHIIKHPAAFALQVLRAFNANQGLLLAGAVAYYTLLSIVPLLILVVIGLSHFVEQAALFETLRRALEWVVQGQSVALVRELAAFLAHRAVLGWVLFGTLLFFSTLAFRVLESAISVIFLHRLATRKRSLLVSLAFPLCYIAFIAFALFAGTVVLANLLAFAGECGLWLAHYCDRGAIEFRDCRHAVVGGGAGDCGVRKNRRRPCGGQGGNARCVNFKVKHWRGSRSKNGWNSAPMLEFVILQTSNPRRPSVGWDPVLPKV